MASLGNASFFQVIVNGYFGRKCNQVQVGKISVYRGIEKEGGFN